jgi:SAM-dependent methyltransferase
MSTDIAWVQWGERDPYFAVITDPKYRSGQITAEAKKEFFATGRWHVGYVLEACRRFVDPAFAPKRALDFGCGVGRVALPLAEQVSAVVGLDVSPAMLAEARVNAEAQGRDNVEWLLSDDTLSAVQGRFDLVHSCITLQHIDPARGRLLIARLLELLDEGGAGAIQVTYGKACHPDTFGQPTAPPPPPPAGGLRSLLRRAEPARDPEMQMNPYNLSELAFMLQTAGVKQFSAQFTDHGGELGVFLFFGKPRQPAA